MGDLDKLIAAVEAGGFDASAERNVPRFNAFADAFEAALGMRPSYADGWSAYRGSLDAALRLHEALLPGWHLTDMWINGDGLMGGAGVWREGVNDSEAFSAHASSPARAWLLAILRALQAKSTPDADTAAIRHHERFGPLDEHGNPLDPRRRG